jgi:cytochrome b involved in lipid metabolism
MSKTQFSLILAGIVILVVGIFLFLQKQNQESKLQEYIQNTDQNKAQETSTTTATSSKSSTNTNLKKTYTLADVALHSTKNDCWMIVHGNVLDVTSFISMHPGGAGTITKGCGKDASDYFDKVSGHMKGPAQALLKKLSIGELAE